MHGVNVLGLGGFEWADAPTKWQVLDIAYRILDVIVLLGFFERAKVFIVAFYIAALSQIVLYTALRPWVVDVPEAFQFTPQQNQYLTTVGVFHGVTIVLVTGAVRFVRLADSGARSPYAA